MDAVDIGRLQQEFLAAMSDSTARLAKSWTDAARKAGLPEVPEKSFSIVESLINPFEVAEATAARSATAGFQRMLDLAASDLPELLKHSNDAVKATRIKDRWMKSYEKTVRETFGIPEPSETERLVKIWRSFLKSPSGIPHTDLLAGMFSNLPVSAWSLAPFFPHRPNSGGEVFQAWAEAYAKTLSYLYSFSGKDMAFEFQEQTEQAVEAQTRFLKSLGRFHEQMVDAARKGLEQVVEKVAAPETKELTPDLYKHFCKTWITAQEKSFAELFKSEKFVQVVSDAVQSGAEAKKNMDALIAGNLAKWNIPSGKYVEDLHEELASVREDLRRLEREVETLRQKVEQLLQQRA